MTLDSDFFAQLASAVIAGTVAAGALGGAFWYLLQRALDQKLAQLLEKQKAELAAEVHRQNTVYSRLDQQRADAVQAINAQLRAHLWRWRDFNPNLSAENPGAKAKEPMVEAFTWALLLNRDAVGVVESTNLHALLLPKALIHNIDTWYMYARAQAVELSAAFLKLAEDDGFLQRERTKQGKMFLQLKRAIPPSPELREIEESLYESLRTILSAIGEIPEDSVKRVNFPPPRIDDVEVIGRAVAQVKAADAGSDTSPSAN